jgi:hypothetical protein
MITMARNKKENKNYHHHPIFDHTIYDLTITAIQFVVPWQMVEAGKKRKDATQLDLNFNI